MAGQRPLGFLLDDNRACRCARHGIHREHAASRDRMLEGFPQS
jgi:hypothetical protein